MIISTPSFDLRAPIHITNVTSADIASISRRVRRVATLDGGAVMADYGYSDADRTLIFTAKGEASVCAQIAELVRDYSSLLLSCETGLFLGSLSLTDNRQDMTLTFLVTEKL